jgi:D-xylose transport system substrate-binding protein
MAKRSRICGAKSDHNALLYKQGQDNVFGPLINRGELIPFTKTGRRIETGKTLKDCQRGDTKAGPNFDAIPAPNDGTAGGDSGAL